jgi:mannose-6-phosphate isomerase-like protein (cupin superfamily)
VVPASAELEAEPGMPLMRSRWVLEPSGAAWDGFALSEWELTAAGWSDRHPHTETNIVLEGELHVEAGGVRVVAVAGDTVTVPAGEVGRYWAPVHARMIAIYGPNPSGASSTDLGYWEL